ncbi:MAG: ABC transporter ATP-binding protein [Gammaproteobacteria bacterium]|nr:ABC transporter ATP-binding protein [Gammaproteobacteria bacterium]MBT4812330.1 ABC transporter ATP-binding protein [Thiotrichales bacterium]MBT3472447.1 ABC transporter ATP-binding protein [Gammaproteobacteria bacterium]MBT3968601.1 ABC transporter ATP-binding protein [Gammaproteobacteria bacterium]MBT4081368.1 ABC transporter ATP-binding protein [Gammaproteobacteria bacterium]
MSSLMSEPSTIKVKQLTRTFDNTHAVDGISFNVAAGSVTALLGGNGAGKTTTLAMLLGLLIPDSGEIEILGVDMVNNRAQALPEMNFSSPYLDLPGRLTVEENLLVYGRLYSVADLRQRIAQLAVELDITQFLQRPYGSLSAGQKTRVSLAKSLLNQPKVLLLDEPTASLDPDTGDRIRTHLEQYVEQTGATVLLASHNMPEVERLCDQVLLMRSGKIIDRGTPQQLLTQYGHETLEAVFLELARGER